MATKSKIEIILGDTRILLIAPHGIKMELKNKINGKDDNDDNTDKITREAVKILGCSGIVNDAVDRKKCDYNKISQASRDTDFIKAIEDVVKADGPTLVVWIHGIEDKNIYKGADKEFKLKFSVNDLHALIGYGQRANPIDKKDTENRYTAQQETVDRFKDLLTQNKMFTILTKPDAEDYRGSHPDNMNQWFVKSGYKFDQVQSIQLEIRKKGFRDDGKNIDKTAKIIASALNELIPLAQKTADEAAAVNAPIFPDVIGSTETTPVDGQENIDVKTGLETQEVKANVHDNNLPVLAGETDADDVFAKEVYSWLEDHFKEHVADFMLKAGKHIIKEFYNGEHQRVFDKKPVRDKSLSLLIKELKQGSGDAPSRSWFFNAVSLAAHEMLFEKRGVQTFGRLGHSQKLLLLHVPDWRKKEKLADDAVKAKYSVREFKDRIKAETEAIKIANTEKQPDTEQKAKLNAMLNEFRKLIKQHKPVPISVEKFLPYIKRSVNAKEKKAKKKESGFNEWTKKNVNICTGCENNCIYCYAHIDALRRKQLEKQKQEWNEMKIRQKDVKKNHPFYGKLIGFPSTHDILPSNIKEYMTVLSKLLRAGNRVLIVSKPRLECIEQICEACQFFKEEILFRFTIGAMDNDTLSFWEPKAPKYEERKECLKYCFDRGFKTSLSMEPMLDASNVDKVIKDLEIFVNGDIWLGTMNRASKIKKPAAVDGNLFSEKIENIIAGQTKEKLREIYQNTKDNPKIKYKKDFRKTAGIE